MKRQSSCIGLKDPGRSEERLDTELNRLLAKQKNFPPVGLGGFELLILKNRTILLIPEKTFIAISVLNNNL